jgi:Holliday junction resolvase RusA-like endonuclease
MDGASSPFLEGTGNWEQFGNTVVFRFRVTGTPKPKARPRTVRNAKTGFVHTYTPETTVNWEQTVVWQVKQALAQVQMDSDISCLPFAGRIVADVRINVERPKSLPKSVEFPMKSRPGDVDNLAKSVLDALQLAGIIEDDKTVTDLSAYKRFANSEHPEGVEVELISWID